MNKKRVKEEQRENVWAKKENRLTQNETTGKRQYESYIIVQENERRRERRNDHGKRDRGSFADALVWHGGGHYHKDPIEV